jgi:hypothetical protein
MKLTYNNQNQSQNSPHAYTPSDDVKTMGGHAGPPLHCFDFDFICGV